MTEHQNHHEMDALLDSLLSAYSAVEPRPGLDLRIRARLRTHAGRQRRMRSLIYASTIALVLSAALLTVRARRTEIPGPVVATVRPSEHVVFNPVTSVTAKPLPERIPFHAGPVSHARRARTLALLQVANSMHGNNDRLVEGEKSYAAATQPDHAAEQEAAGDKAGIQNLGVESIEIKELAPTRSDEKGN